MNEKFNKNAKVEKFTSMLGIAVRLIVIDPFTSDWIFAWQNMAHIGDLGVKKLPNFYEFCPTCVNVVTIKSLNAVYYERTWYENYIDI